LGNLYNIHTNLHEKNKSLPKLIDFLKSQHLDYDDHITFSVTLTDTDDTIIATGSLDNNIIKCLAVSDQHRDEGLAANIVSQLISKAAQNGIRKLFVYTKPLHEKMFNGLGFYTIEKTQNVLLMENVKNGFNDYLDTIKTDTNHFIAKNNIQANTIGCIIANCNPFTNGHLYLIGEASKQCDVLHIFILSGSNEFFNEAERVFLVKEGLKDFKNIIVHYAKEYILSPLTFPTYFIKDKKQTSIINCNLDIAIFLKKIVPLLHITHRFVGTESNDLVTNAYNNELIKALTNSTVALIILERKKVGSSIISASTVRKYIENNDFQKIKDFVPSSTYDFILSKFTSTSRS
jgi:[citrate (pro-3S)-lyase] ligase